MKKSKFGNLNFDSVETLSREELKKVKGGYGNDGNFIIQNPSYSIQCLCDGTQFPATTNYTGCCSIRNAIDTCNSVYVQAQGHYCYNGMLATTC